MKILGIIAEYNPFHQGHAIQIKASLKKSQSDAVMVLMSGSITQRGEFAMLNKWERTRLALSSGVDLVCELPFAYACQTAETFAQGAVKIFDRTGVIDTLSFGSELGSLPPLQQLSKILVDEPAPFKFFLKQALDTGISFPKARETAIRLFCVEPLSKHLSTPNNILAIEYLKALYKRRSLITPMTIKRQGAGHHSLVASHTPSAGAIRKMVVDIQNHPENQLENIALLDEKLPYPVENLLIPHARTRHCNGDVHLLNALRLMILSHDVAHLKQTPYVNEGLEHKIRDAFKTAPDWDTCVRSITSKRIPETRVRRILCNRLLKLDQETLALFSAESFTPYLRVLGFTPKGRAILKAIKSTENLPILTNLKKSKFCLDPIQQKMLDYDCRATDLHNQFYEKHYQYHRDYLMSPIQALQDL